MDNIWRPWLREDNGREFRRYIRQLEARNSVLLGFDVFHHIEQDGPAPAWSQGDEIWFNQDALPVPDTRENIIFLTGVNNHEVGHLQFTPTPDDVQRTFPGYPNDMHRLMMGDKQYRNVWNILEDQRMEMLMIRRYANQRPYFLAAFANIVLTQKDYLDTAYLLARGRRYLPLKIRRMLKRKFKAPKAIPQIRRIIDAYCKLNLFRGQDLYEAHRLITQMIALLEEHKLWPEGAQDHDGCKAVEVMVTQPKSNRKDRIDQERVAAEVRAVAKQIEEENDEEKLDGAEAGMGEGDGAEGESGQGGGADGPGTPADGDADGPGQGDGGNGQGDASGDGTDGQGGSSDADGEDGDGTGAGTGGGSGDVDLTDDDVREAIAAVAVQALNTGDIGRDIADQLRMLRGTPDIDARRVTDMQRITPEMPAASRRIATALRKIETESDPYWERRTSAGKLNIQRVMTHPNDRDYAFDRWQEGGLGGNDQEWAVLLDASQSMKEHMFRLAQTNWMMKRAADQVGAALTSLAWGSTWARSVEPFRLLYGPNDKAHGSDMPGIPDMGGTTPAPVLLETYRLLGQSKHPIKGMLIMTDGDWVGAPDSSTPFRTNEAIIKAMNDMGVITHLVYFPTGRQQRTVINAHGCQGATMLGDITDMVGIMKDLISRAMKVSQRR